MALDVNIVADTVSFPYVSFDRSFWDSQKLDLFDAIVALGKSIGDDNADSVHSVKNLYWFVTNIDDALDNHDVAIIIPSEGM